MPEIVSKKQSVEDVLCNRWNGVYIIVEMQVSPQCGFEKRVQYYVTKAYSRQLFIIYKLYKSILKLSS